MCPRTFFNYLWISKPPPAGFLKNLKDLEVLKKTTYSIIILMYLPYVVGTPKSGKNKPNNKKA